MHLKFLILLRINQFSCFKIWKINSKVHISKEALVIMKAFVLSHTNTKVVESVIEDLSHVFHPLCGCVLARFKVRVQKCEGSVFKVEAE